MPDPLPFSDAMHQALYGPGGYYSSGPARIGKKGDFITSVSAGPCFGTLLARHYIDLWEKNHKPPGFLAVEQGAHDAQLAADILDALTEFHSPLRDALHLCLIEPSPHLRAQQRQTLSTRLPENRLTQIDTPSDLATHPLITTPGIFLTNELQDAFPVHLVKFQNGVWQELHLTSKATPNNPPTRTLSALPPQNPDLIEALKKLPTGLPEGYQTEVQLAPARWIKDVAASGFTGEICIIDYGLERGDYYAPHRTQGTIRRYHNHKTDGNILENFGQSDLTTHVEWTTLKEAAAAAGLEEIGWTDQHHFLIQLATPWLQELEAAGQTGDTEPRIRQLQTLIHPTSMGRAFQVLRLRSPHAK